MLRNYPFQQAQSSDFPWLEYNRIQQNMWLLHHKSVNSYGWSTFHLLVYLNVNKLQMERLNKAVNMHFSINSLFFYRPLFKKKFIKLMNGTGICDLTQMTPYPAFMGYKEAKCKNITQKYKPTKLRQVLYRWRKRDDCKNSISTKLWGLCIISPLRQQETYGERNTYCHFTLCKTQSLLWTWWKAATTELVFWALWLRNKEVST